MRSDDPGKTQGFGKDQGLKNGDDQDIAASFMTARGTRYWDNGSIPLIGPDILGSIIATASDIAFVVEPGGKILSLLINPDHNSFGQLDHWVGRDLREFLTSESIPKFDEKLGKVTRTEETGGAVELNHADNAVWSFPIRYSFHNVGPEGAVLMLGRDLRPIAEMQQQLVRAQAALEQDYEIQREYDTRYRILMDTTRDAVVFVSLRDNKVRDINSRAAKLFGADGDDLAGQAFIDLFEPRKGADLLELLSDPQAQEKLVSARIAETRRSVTFYPRIFRAAGERFLVCRIEGSEADAPAASELNIDLARFFERGVDAILFTDVDGRIKAANDSFLDMVDVADQRQLVSKSLAEFLGRGSFDLKVLLDNAMRAGQMRIYATQLETSLGKKVSAEFSVTMLGERTNATFAFLIRDVSRVEAVRKPISTVSDDGLRSVIELLGSSTLKDIVAETTDVVEKMCIETAVELTHNNRVAAAEMLGLSRQSLYVKLRKFGLLKKNDE